MKSLNDKRIVNAANAWGRYEDVPHETFVVEQSDVGTERQNYRGNGQPSYRFSQSDVGRAIDVIPGCWAFFQTVNPFTNTKAALLIYDQGKAERDAVWAKIETNEDAEAATEMDAAAKRAVQEAFYVDTSTINSLSNCYLVDLDFMRRMAK